MRRKMIVIVPVAAIVAALISVGGYIAVSFPDVSVQTLMFYMANGAQGFSDQTFSLLVDKVWWLFILVFAVLIAGVYVAQQEHMQRLRHRAIPRVITLERAYLLLLAVVLCGGLFYFGATEYVVAQYFKKSSLYEDYYVYPSTERLQFPEQNRNLVMIFVESLEATVASKQSGGAWPYSLIPELESLANENVSFSNTNGLGGAPQTASAENTTTGLVAQTSGTALSVGGDSNLNNNFNNYKNYLPGLVSLADILEQQGYSQRFILGSDADFGNRKTYFVQHGNVEIFDYPAAQSTGAIPSDYKEWWGYEDRKLFEFGKQAAAELANHEGPFALTLLTADTHFVDGWLDPSCDDITLNGQYENVHACSSRMIAVFVDWLKQQDFYDDTTVVIVGDHLGMQTSFYTDMVPAGYTRTVFNAYINAAATPMREKNRQLSPFDTFPTVLGAMGVTIDGNRLGLGTNLFSGEDTLTERIGMETLNREISQRNDFYRQCILGGECPE